jgi:hypothetical protein
MCVVSAVHDYGRQHSDDWWTVGRWHEFQDLVKQAEKFDKATGQPHCEDPEKTAFMKRIEEKLDVLTKKVEDALNPEDEPDELALYGSNVLPAVLNIKGHEFQLGYIVNEAYGHFDGTAHDWNALTELEREHRLMDAVYRIRARLEAAGA